MTILLRAVRLQSAQLPAILLTGVWITDAGESCAEAWLIYPTPRADGKEAFKRFVGVNRPVPEEDVYELATLAIAVDIEGERLLRDPNWSRSPADDVAIDEQKMQLLRLLAPYSGMDQVNNDSFCHELQRFVGTHRRPAAIKVVNEGTHYPEAP